MEFDVGAVAKRWLVEPVARRAPEEQTFQAELDKLEVRQKEDIMETLTSWEKKGVEKGVAQATQRIALGLLGADAKRG